MYIKNTKIHDTTVTTEIMGKGGLIRGNGSELGCSVVKNAAENDGSCASVVAATINQEHRAPATVVEEIRCDLNVIAPRYAIFPHPIIIPPTIGRISNTSSEVVRPKVDDRVEIVDKVLAR